MSDKSEKKAWEVPLLVDAKGNYKSTLPNATHILTEHPALRVTREDDEDDGGQGPWIGFNEFHWCKMKLRELPWGRRKGYGRWEDVDTALVREWLGRWADFSTEVVKQAVTILADRNRFHEVRRGLESLEPWDKVDRVSDFLSRYFGTDDNEYTRAVGRAWILSAVARAMEPGCKADCMLILEGEQGEYKSTALKELAGAQLFSDDKIDFNDAKEAMSSLEGSWIRELPELEGMSKASVNTVKAFVSKQIDKYRPAYGHEMIVRPRSLVFAATTNEYQYLDDGSGGRRFWPVRVVRPCRWEAIRDERRQIWAQVLELYRGGESWYLKPGTTAALMAGQEQSYRKKGDPVEPPVVKWVLGEGHKRALAGQGITTHDVLSEALKILPSNMDRSWEIRIGMILRGLEWSTVRLRARASQAAEKNVLTDQRDSARLRSYFPNDYLQQVEQLRAEIEAALVLSEGDEDARKSILLKSRETYSVETLRVLFKSAIATDQESRAKDEKESKSS